MKFIINSDILSKIFNIQSALSEEINIFFKENLISFQNKSAGYTMLSEILVGKKALGRYEKEKNLNHIKFKLKNIRAFIVSLKNKPVDMTITKDYITIEYRNRKLTERLLDITEDKEFGLPDERTKDALTFDYILSLNAESLNEVIKIGNSIGDNTNIKSLKKKGILIKISDTEELSIFENVFATIKFKKLEDSEAIFTTEFLIIMLRFLNGTLTLSGGNQKPIKAEERALENVLVKFMVAPKINIKED